MKYMNQSEGIKNLRIAFSMSQEDFAHKVGTTAKTISRWENGESKPAIYFRRKLIELQGEIDSKE